MAGRNDVYDSVYRASRSRRGERAAAFAMTGLGRMMVADRVPPVNGAAAPCTADDATVALNDECHESAALLSPQKIALNAVRLPKFEPVNGISWSSRKIMVKDLRQRPGLA